MEKKDSFQAALELVHYPLGYDMTLIMWSHRNIKKIVSVITFLMKLCTFNKPYLCIHLIALLS